MLPNLLGILLVLILFLVLLVLIVANSRFNRRVRRDATKLLSGAVKGGESVVTGEMIRGLPAPVQRYLTYAGIVGRPFISTARLKQVGKFRDNAQQPWMPLDAKQYYSVNPPGFVWDGTLRMRGLPVIRAEDQYQDGKGEMLIKMAALGTIADALGQEIDQGEMTRYLNEMMWFPSAYLGKNITWKAINDSSAEVTLTDKGKSISATLYIDRAGKLTNFVTQRYWEENGEHSLETWSTPITAYGEFDGLNLPKAVTAVWNLPDGDLEYIGAEITKLEYDVPTVFGERNAQ